MRSLVKAFVVAGIALVLGQALTVEAQPARSGAAVLPGLPSVADLQVGTFIQVEGRLVEGVLHAKQIEVYAAPLEDETLDAAIEEVDLDAETLTVAGRTVAISVETKIRDADKAPLDLFDVEVGQMAKSKGTRDEDGTLIARRVRIKPKEADPEKASKIKIKSLIQEVDAEAQTLVLFDMKVKFTPQTEYKVGT